MENSQFKGIPPSKIEKTKKAATQEKTAGRPFSNAFYVELNAFLGFKNYKISFDRIIDLTQLYVGKEVITVILVLFPSNNSFWIVRYFAANLFPI